MGYTNDEEEQRLSTSDAEETLPLYEESQRDNASELQPPDEKATPDEVRDFLVQVMRIRPGIGIDHARRIAGRWTLGTGRELKTYPVAMYREVFGPEDGWVVYKEVKSMYYAKDKKTSVPERWAFFVMFLITGALSVTGMWLLFADNIAEGWRIAGVPLMLFGGFTSLTFAILTCVSAVDPEKKAEEELKNQWHKAAAGSGTI